jgi:DinB superfamily
LRAGPVGSAGTLSMWERADERLDRRLSGLTDAEYFWAPVPDAWTVYEGTTGWTYDYDFAPPPPAPVTTIAWRLVHIAANNWIYWDYAFGTAAKTFPDLTVPSTADDARRNWRASAAPVAAWLATAKPADLDEPRPNHLGQDLRAGHIVGILLDELVHHGAEIALLRDLCLRAGD